MQNRGTYEAQVAVVSKQGSFLGLAARSIQAGETSNELLHNGALSIALDGEIYNLEEVASSLGIPAGKTTTENIVLEAYKKWGEECPRYLEGAFAFAIADRENDLVYCARDKFGEKPFFYYHTNDEFVFASELKALMSYPYFEKQIDPAALGMYFSHNYISAPQCIFKKTYKLAPGHSLICRSGAVCTRSYWSIAQLYHANSGQTVRDYDQALKELAAWLEKAITKRIPADLIYGTFLSGGIDSTLVTIITQKLSETPVKTFTIGFEDPKYNEADAAKKIASHLKTDHSELYIDHVMLLNLVHKIPEYYDEPFGDSSQIATFFACQLAKSQVDVVLTGDGGDILFWGFDTYTKLKKYQRLDVIGAILYYILKPLHLLRKMPLKMRMVCENRDIGTKSQMFNTYSDDIIRSVLIHPCETLHYDIEKEFSLSNWGIRKGLVDLITFAPSLLNKVGSASASMQLITRNPYLDQNVVGYSMRIPPDFKYRKGVKKRILRDLAYKSVPREMIDRPKHGFSVPHSQWLKEDLAEDFAKYTDKEFIETQGLFNYEVLFDLKEHFVRGDVPLDFVIQNFFWSFFVFQMWYEMYVM